MAVTKRTYNDPCGIARALDAVGERWALLVVRELLLGPKRFGQLHEGLAGTSPNVLSQRLRELEDSGVVRRTRLDPPAQVVVYELTPRGAALEPVLLALGDWGSSTPRIPGREMSTDAFLLALKTTYRPRPGVRIAFELIIDGEPHRLVTEQDRLKVTRGRAGSTVPNVEATLAADVRTLRNVVFLRTPMRAAEESGALTIVGNRRTAVRFATFFRVPTPYR